MPRHARTLHIVEIAQLNVVQTCPREGYKSMRPRELLIIRVLYFPKILK